MKNFILPIAALLVVALSSCFGDLNVEPADQDVFLAEDFYTDAASYRQGLAGVYGNLSLTGTGGEGSSNISGIDGGTSQYARVLWFLNEFTTDEAKWTYENDPGLAELNRNTWSANNVVLLGGFSRVMLSVAFANEYLRQTTDELLTQRGVNDALRADIAVYRAEARFLRALSYYHMMDWYGKAPFVTEASSVGAEQPEEINRAELFAFIESELLDIVGSMAAPQTNEYGRADQAAAWMLLAKIYLNAEVYTGTDRYSDCMTYCQNILGSSYSLTGEFLHNFTADNNISGANEIIFPVVFDGTNARSWGVTTVLGNGQIGSVEGNASDYHVRGWGGAIRVTRQFSEVMLNGTYDNDDRNTMQTTDRTIDITDITRPATGYVVYKWSNLTSDGLDGSDIDILDIDFPMFRLADVYLMYAEAFLRGGGGDAGTAVSLINDLRTRANNPNMINTADLTLDLVLEERLVELYWEGHRRQDLIRYGLYTGSQYLWNWKGNALSGIPIPSYRSIFPIPAQSLAANGNLSQNTGY